MNREDISKTLQTLVKYNNGFWKSEKQRDYLVKMADAYGDLHSDREASLANFGVDHDLPLLYIEHQIRFADYGARSYRRVGWMFAFDDQGIVAKWRIRFNFDNATTRSWPAPEKTEQEWARSADSVSTMRVEEKVERPISHYIGSVGDKISATLTIKKMVAMSGQIGYARVYSDLIIMEDEHGNCVTWNSSSAYKFDSLKEGNQVTLMGTIKAHKEYKGRQQTVLTRCKLV